MFVRLLSGTRLQRVGSEWKKTHEKEIEQGAWGYSGTKTVRRQVRTRGTVEIEIGCQGRHRDKTGPRNKGCDRQLSLHRRESGPVFPGPTDSGRCVE